MRAEDIQSFARRDWEQVSATKAAWWAARTAEERLKIGAALWEHMQRVRPDWPSEAERQADLNAHIALSHLLRNACGDS
jgi:hypothetical protein